MTVPPPSAITHQYSSDIFVPSKIDKIFSGDIPMAKRPDVYLFVVVSLEHFNSN
jgi:hypothetical protein